MHTFLYTHSMMNVHIPFAHSWFIYRDKISKDGFCMETPYGVSDICIFSMYMYRGSKFNMA